MYRHQLSSMELRVNKLPIGANYLRCKAFNPTDVNSVIANFYQIGPYSRRTKALLDLLDTISDDPLFDAIRTNEQLAYQYSFDVFTDTDILGYGITAEYIDERIEKFRRELKTIIEKMSNEDFDLKKETRAKSNLNKITSSEFDLVKKENEHLLTITKDQFLEFYDEHYGKNKCKLSIQVIGNALADQVQEQSEMEPDLETHRKQFDQLLTDLVGFKKSLEVYPVTETN